MGHRKAIGTPTELFELFIEFKKWIFSEPIMKAEFNAKVGDIVYIPLQRPLTWSRFDTWIADKGIIEDLEDYRQNRDDRYSDYGGIITRINREMKANKFEGASVGIFNANIIARDLGLVDKQELENNIHLKDKINLNIIFEDFS